MMNVYIGTLALVWVFFVIVGSIAFLATLSDETHDSEVLVVRNFMLGIAFFPIVIPLVIYGRYARNRDQNDRIKQSDDNDITEWLDRKLNKEPLRKTMSNSDYNKWLDRKMME